MYRAAALYAIKNGIKITEENMEKCLDDIDIDIRYDERGQRIILKGEDVSETDIEELDEAASLQNISKMPARVKCAVLGWHTMEEMLKGGKNEASGSVEHCSTE